MGYVRIIIGILVIIFGITGWTLTTYSSVIFGDPLPQNLKLDAITEMALYSCIIGIGVMFVILGSRSKK